MNLNATWLFRRYVLCLCPKDINEYDQKQWVVKLFFGTENKRLDLDFFDLKAKFLSLLYFLTAIAL